MSKEERTEFVETKSKERAAIQEQILKLEKEAGEFREEALEDMSGAPSTLDQVMLEAVREQAKAKEFKSEGN